MKWLTTDPTIDKYLFQQLLNSKQANILHYGRDPKRLFLFTNETMFDGICEHNDLKSAKWWWNVSNPTNYNIAFNCSCIHGSITIALWLWRISNNSIDIHDHNSIYSFYHACDHKHFHIAEWLWFISNKSIDEKNY